MRILITGAAGYLGANLTKYLHRKGIDVIAWCRSIDIKKEEILRNFTTDIILGDILNNECIQKALSLEPDVIIHLVSLDQKQSEIDAEKANQTNVLPTFKLLEAFKNTNLNKFIYFSTIQVLGPLDNKIVDADFKPNPQNIYGLTHLLSEQLMHFYEPKAAFKPIIVRLANSYGSPVFDDNNCWWLVVNNLCKMAYQEKKIILQSDGSPQRDFVHVNDIGKSLELLVRKTNNNLNNNLLYIANGVTYTMLEVALLVKAIYLKRYGLSLPLITTTGEIHDSNCNQNQFQKYKIDISALNQMGIHPEINLEEGIEELFDYLEKQ